LVSFRSSFAKWLWAEDIMNKNRKYSCLSMLELVSLKVPLGVASWWWYMVILQG